METCIYFQSNAILPPFSRYFYSEAHRSEEGVHKRGGKGSCFSIRRDVSRIESVAYGVAYGASRVPRVMSPSSSSSSRCANSTSTAKLATLNVAGTFDSRGRENVSRKDVSITTLSPPAGIRAAGIAGS